MRRSLLTARPASPITMGSDPTASYPSGWGGGQVINMLGANPATIGGTLNTLQVKAAAIGEFHVLVGSFVSGTFTVRATSGALSPASTGTVLSYAVNMPVLAGDYIAIWWPGSGFGINYGGTGGINYGGTVSSAPGPGNAYFLSSGWGATLPVQGLGFG